MTSKCRFCSKEILDGSDSQHPSCHQDHSSLMEKLIGPRNNASPLDDKINLVFEGGGVKGMAYQGVLEELQEVKRNGSQFLDGVKRVAGSSAGSLVALYLGLGMSVQEIEPLMSQPFAKFLDEELALKVIIRKFPEKTENFKVKDIVLAALIYLNQLQTELGDPKTRDRASENYRDLIKDIFHYNAWKLVDKKPHKYLVLKVGGSSFLADLTKWLLDMLNPVPESGTNQKLESFKLLQKTSGSAAFEAILNEECDVLAQGEKNERDKLEKLKQNYDVYRASLDEYCGKSVNQERSTNLKNSRNNGNKDEVSFEEFLEDVMGKLTQEGEQKFFEMQEESFAPEPEFNFQDPSTESLINNLNSNMKKDSLSMKGLDGELRLIRTQDSKMKAEFPMKYLADALGELLWFIVKSQTDANENKRPVGLFDGSVIKKELLVKPIEDCLKKLDEGHPKAEEITFGELMKYHAKLKLKQFYVTAFNTEKLRTEVFSAEHTPDVVVADAVRASMSIPIFFTAVPIREKSGNFLGGDKDKGVFYMDGGILDNFPLHILDDYKYCFDEDRNLASGMPYSIANPHTIGFRLRKEPAIQRYKTLQQGIPGVTDMDMKGQSQETFSYQMGLLVKAWIGEAQENEHEKRGHYLRSVFVENIGVSSIAFNLTEEQKKELIEAGRKAVKKFLTGERNPNQISDESGIEENSK